MGCWDRGETKPVRNFLAGVMLAVAGGIVSFAVAQANHAAERLYWADYERGAVDKQEFWARYVGDAKWEHPHLIVPAR